MIPDQNNVLNMTPLFSRGMVSLTPSGGEIVKRLTLRSCDLISRKSRRQSAVARAAAGDNGGSILLVLTCFRQVIDDKVVYKSLGMLMTIPQFI